tara:strand:- start:20219 stop:20797 length:579 start_codon:yes stop_codon:yes gene_type:complete
MRFTNDRINFLEYISEYIPKGSVAAEIGVFKGEFSDKILKQINPKKLYLIDPWELGYDKNGETATYKSTNGEKLTAYSNEENSQEVKEKFHNEIIKGQVSIQVGYSYDVVEEFPDNYFDFIYIDGCHLYGCVKSDLNMYWPKLKKGGLMCGHDYHDNYPGVIKAVEEFKPMHGLKLLAISNHTDWALTPKNT